MPKRMVPLHLLSLHPLQVFFRIHFRAPWGTEPYVALHFVYLCVTFMSFANNISLTNLLASPSCLE